MLGSDGINGQLDESPAEIVFSNCHFCNGGLVHSHNYSLI
jgi:hypothetical protein